MNIRNAILKAADSIASSPHLFKFMTVQMPDNCGTPGCAIGWIIFHSDISVRQFPSWATYKEPMLKAMGIKKSGDFYKLLDGLDGSLGWRHSAPICAKLLRLYADKYHPITNHIPSSVRAIFEVEPVDA